MSIQSAIPVLPYRRAAAPGWLAPWAAAVLAWNLLALLGALASYGDTRHAAVPAAFATTLLRFVLMHLPLSAFSLVLAIGFQRAQSRRLPLARLAPAYLATLLAGMPLLGMWRGVIDSAFGGQPLAGPLTLLAQQTALSWWFDGLTMTLAFGAHLAYGAWRHAHAQALAWQLARQGNLALRLRLLQGQLEPYFLSSALAGIGRLTRDGARDQATRALARLSELLRYALRASRSDQQSVADEVQFLRDYVDLQRVCHGAGPAVEWRLAGCDWDDLRCPPLLLFPLLEQALVTPPSWLAIELATQAGTPPLVVVQLSYASAAAGVGGAALTALQARLAMLYGAAASLAMDADGAAVWLRLSYPASHHEDAA